MTDFGKIGARERAKGEGRLMVNGKIVNREGRRAGAGKDRGSERPAFAIYGAAGWNVEFNLRNRFAL